MISTNDTIVAIATPRGRGALGMVRLSGGDSIRIASALTDRAQGFVSRYATLCCVRGIDEVTNQIILEDIYMLRSRSGLKETHAQDAELVHTGYVPEFAEYLINDGLLTLEAFT